MPKYSLLLVVVLFALVSHGESAHRMAGRGIMTWYSHADNSNNIGSFDNKLVPFKSVAMTRKNGKPKLREKLYIPKLKGFPLGNGKVHDGWVRVDDECLGSGCKFLDIYVGSNAQRDRYRKWMRGKHKTDPDQLPIVAYGH